MIIRVPFPASLSKHEKEEIMDCISRGGKYVLFEYQPNDRRIDLNKVDIYGFISEGGSKNNYFKIYGTTAMALNSLYNLLYLKELHHINVLCDTTCGEAYLLEDIINDF